MRITNSMMMTNMMSNLSNNMNKMNKYQSQLATNKRITKISDDPVGVVQSLQARLSLSKTGIYKTTAEDAKSWLTNTETALMDINSLIQRAYELTLDAANDTKGPEERQAIAVEINQIRDEFISSLNSTYGTQYIFGGYNVNTAPFEKNGSNVSFNQLDLIAGDPGLLNGMKTESINYEIGSNVLMDVSISGLRVVGQGPDNLFNMFQNLADNLNANQPLNDFIGKLKSSQEHIMSLTSEVGGKTNRLDSVISRYENDEINYLDLQSRIEDIDQAEVITQFKMQEAVYRAALAVGARIIQPSLVDFLK